MLKEFREHLGYNQKEFAELINKSQNTISRWEDNPETLSINQISEIAKSFGVNELDLISFSPENKTRIPWKINDNYINDLVRLDTLTLDIENSFFHSQNILLDLELTEQQIALRFLDDKRQFLATLKEFSSRPKVTFIGESDSGKSTLINTLLGKQLLPTNYTPETSTGIKIAHINSKPKWLGFDNTAVFKHSVDEEMLDTHKIRDANYYEKHLVEDGSEQLIVDYGSYDGKHFDDIRKDDENFYTIITYIDVPLLLACEVWDIPGGGTTHSEDLSDDLISKTASEGADIIVFLSTAAKFLHTYDLVTLKDTIESLPLLNPNQNNINPLSNLFIIASQSGQIIQNDSNIDEIIHKRLQAFDGTLPNEFWVNFKEKRSIDDSSTNSTSLINRTFIFERDDIKLQQKFKYEFINLLEALASDRIERIEEYYRIQSDYLIINSFNHSLNQVLNTLDYEKKTIHKTIEDYQTLIVRKTEFLNNNSEFLDSMRNLAISYSKNSRDEIIQMYKQILTEENIYNLLVLHKVEKDRESKEEFITSLQNQLVEKANKIVEGHHIEFMDQLVHELKELVDKDPSISVNLSNENEPLITSDHLNLLFGSLASAGTAELFNIYFASFGNLGGYIPVTKVVSFLKDIGINVPGGTRGATQFIKKIGGPETVTVAIAVAVGASVYALTGRDWKKSFSKHIIKSFTKTHKIKGVDKPHSFGSLLQIQAINFWNNIASSLSTEDIAIEIQQLEDELKQISEIDAKTLDSTRTFLESLYLPKIN